MYELGQMLRVVSGYQNGQTGFVIKQPGVRANNPNGGYEEHYFIWVGTREEYEEYCPTEVRHGREGQVRCYRPDMLEAVDV